MAFEVISYLKPTFAVASKQIADLFDNDNINYDLIFKIANYIIQDSLRGHHLLLGIIPGHMTLKNILGNTFSEIKGNRDLESKLDMIDLAEQIHKHYEINCAENRNVISCVYFKIKDPQPRPLFFSQICVPLGNKAIVLLNKRKNYIYVGKYHSNPEDVAIYNEELNKLRDQERFLNYQSVINMLIHSREIHRYYMDSMNRSNF